MNDDLHHARGHGLSSDDLREAADLVAASGWPPRRNALARRLRAAADDMDRSDTLGHLVHFDDEGWTVVHPLSERMDDMTLLSCRARWGGDDPGVRGTYRLLSNTEYGEIPAS
jgi:hypothetical protein